MLNFHASRSQNVLRLALGAEDEADAAAETRTQSLGCLAANLICCSSTETKNGMRRKAYPVFHSENKTEISKP